MNLSLNQIAEITDHSVKIAPHEACGFILKDGRVICCENKAHDKTSFFMIDQADTEKYLEDSVAYWHSHVFSSCNPSFADLQYQFFIGLDSVIYSVKDQEIKIIKHDEAVKIQEEQKIKWDNQSPCEFIDYWYSSHFGISLKLSNLNISVLDESFESKLSEHQFFSSHDTKIREGDLIIFNYNKKLNEPQCAIAKDEFFIFYSNNGLIDRSFFGSYWINRVKRIYRKDSLKRIKEYGNG